MDHQHASERNQDSLGRQVHLNARRGYRWVTSSNTNDSHDEFADTHSSSADEEKFSTPDSVDELNTEDGHDGINDICNNPAKGEIIKHRS